MRFEPGTRLDVVMTKWGGRPHWEFPVTYLGEDEHGDWLGIPADTRFARPGMDFHSTNTQVALVPRGEWWVAGFHDHDGPPRPGWANLGGAPVDVYVDMATPVVFDGTTVRCVDLDLDVVRGTTGVVMVDDEDEFAEHQVTFSYPAEVIAAAQASCHDVRRRAEGRTGPFDGVAPRAWLGRVTAP